MEKKDVQVIKKTNAKVTRTGLYIEVWTGRGGQLLGYLSFFKARPNITEYWCAEIVRSKEEVSTRIAIDYYDDGEMEIWADGKSWGNLGYEFTNAINYVVMREGNMWSYWAFDGDTSTVAPLKISSPSSRGEMIYYPINDDGSCRYGDFLFLGQTWPSYMLAYFAVTT